MGKRKSRKKPPSKISVKVATTFNCPFCNHEGSVEAKLDRSGGVGSVRCGMCQEHFQMRITDLTDPIDIYSEWIDECERTNREPSDE